MPTPARALAAAAILAACATPSRPGPGGAPAAASGGVALRFAWPDSFRARVIMRHETRRSDGGATGAIIQQELAVESHGSELWVVSRNSRGEGDDPDLELDLKLGEAVIQVVSRDGAVLRAAGLAQAVARLVEDDASVDRDAARRGLARAAAEDWEVSVGAWRGQRFEPGQPRRKRVEGSLPLLPGVAASLDVEYGLRGRVPCEDDAEPRCVELTYVETTSPGDRGALLERLRAGMQKGSEQGTIEDASARSEATLVTEPDTLVPHRLTIRQELRLRLRAPDGAARTVEERSEDRYRFSSELEI